MNSNTTGTQLKLMARIAQIALAITLIHAFAAENWHIWSNHAAGQRDLIDVLLGLKNPGQPVSGPHLYLRGFSEGLTSPANLWFICFTIFATYCSYTARTAQTRPSPDQSGTMRNIIAASEMDPTKATALSPRQDGLEVSPPRPPQATSEPTPAQPLRLSTYGLLTFQWNRALDIGNPAVFTRSFNSSANRS